MVTTKPKLGLGKSLKSLPSPSEQKPKASLGLASALRSGSAAERAEVDVRLDAAGVQRSPGEGGILNTPTYGGRSNSSAHNLVIKARLAELVSNPFNPRVFYIPEKIDELAVKLKRDGQHEKIKITRNYRFPNMYVIVDGEYRSRAMRSLGDEFIDAEVLPDLSDQDLYLIANSINTDRTPQSIFDNAVAWQKLLDQGIFPDRSSLAQAVGEELPKVSKTLTMNALPEHLLVRMSSASIGLAQAYNLKLIFERQGIVIAEGVLDRVIDGELSVRRLEDMAKKAEGSVPPRAVKKLYNMNVAFHTVGGRNIGSLKRYEDGRAELKLEGLTPDQQSLLASQLEKLVKDFVAENVIDPAESESTGT